MTYTVFLYNEGYTTTLNARMSDTWPISTTFLSGTLRWSAGEAGYDPASRTITWSGSLAMYAQVWVTFAVTTHPGLPEGTPIVKRALIQDGFRTSLWRTATATVVLPPVLLATRPADGETGVPLTATVVLTFSEAMSTTPLSLTAQPDPGGWSATWSADDTVVTLQHAPFAYDTPYTLTVWALDAQGEDLVPGPVPNPWTFATLPTPPMYRLYLPLVLHGYAPASRR